MSTTTPVFGFIRPSSDDYAHLLGDNMGAMVDRLEAVLRNYVTSPDVANLNAEIAARQALTTRLNTRCTVTSGGFDATNATPNLVNWQARSGLSLASMWASGNPSRLVVPTTGEYDLSVGVSWAVSSTGARSIAYRVNGGTNQWIDSKAAPAAPSGAEQSATFRGISLNAGQYVEILLQQTSGALFGTGGLRATLSLALS